MIGYARACGPPLTLFECIQDSQDSMYGLEVAEIAVRLTQLSR